MALPRHHAADRQQSSGSEAEFLGAEQGSDDHVAGKLQAAIHAQPNPRPQSLPSPARYVRRANRFPKVIPCS